MNGDWRRPGVPIKLYCLQIVRKLDNKMIIFLFSIWFFCCKKLRDWERIESWIGFNTIDYTILIESQLEIRISDTDKTESNSTPTRKKEQIFKKYFHSNGPLTLAAAKHNDFIWLPYSCMTFPKR